MNTIPATCDVQLDTLFASSGINPAIGCGWAAIDRTAEILKRMKCHLVVTISTYR